MHPLINSQNGELAAVLGGTAGAIIFITLGIFAAEIYNRLFGIYGLSYLLPRAIGICLGCWIGEVVGCWLGLHWVGEGNAGLTATLLALLTPFGIGLFWWLVSVGVIDDPIKLKSLLLEGLLLMALPWLARFWVMILV